MFVIDFLESPWRPAAAPCCCVLAAALVSRWWEHRIAWGFVPLGNQQKLSCDLAVSSLGLRVGGDEHLGDLHTAGISFGVFISDGFGMIPKSGRPAR